MEFECPLPITEYDTVTLGHGGGGKLSQRLIEQMFLPGLANEALAELGDGAVLDWPGGRMAVSTDSFVVRPPFFPGGDIGLLAVHGTTNDLAMCGARPRHLTLAFILEEGFLLTDLWKVLRSIRGACDELGIAVVTGDTKVVERGKGDGIYINTTGVGQVLEGIELGAARIAVGDHVVLSGPIAEHGMAIMSVREGLEFESPLRSDTAALWPAVEGLLRAGDSAVHALRDATRGGVASVLNELAGAAGLGVVIEEGAIPVDEPVRAACEFLGLDPLYVANEGRFVAFVDPSRSAELLELLREHPLGRGAVIVGEVVDEHPRLVRMKSTFGGSRVVDMISGEQLPRIC